MLMTQSRLPCAAWLPQHTEGDVVVERSRFEAVKRSSTLPQEPRSMRFAGGTGALVSALMDALPIGRMHLGTRVSRVAILDDGWNPYWI
jgi:hypothetical protein